MDGCYEKPPCSPDSAWKPLVDQSEICSRDIKQYLRDNPLDTVLDLDEQGDDDLDRVPRLYGLSSVQQPVNGHACEILLEIDAGLYKHFLDWCLQHRDAKNSGFELGDPL